MSTNTANLGFEDKIWRAADKLRGNMDASEYKHVVLGLIFLKYISDSFEEKYNKLVEEGYGFEEDRDAYLAENIFFVPETARWSYVSSFSNKKEIGTVIDEAMIAIEEENKRLAGLLPKNFAREELDKSRLGEVVDLFTNIKLADYSSKKDILGRTYEYCLSKFAEQEGKRAGEFYTPSSIVRTLVEILEPYNGRVYDPACGAARRPQEDPLGKSGVVGAFCRAFSITEAIDAFLSDVYATSAIDGRYDYIPADSSAGVVIYDEKFAYSHHATDPACGKLLNAFDLVRIHRFGDSDEKASYQAMCEFATQQPTVRTLLTEEREKQAQYDFSEEDVDWKSKLTYMPRSKLLENSVWNLMLILTHDPDFAFFGYNEMASRIQVIGKVPWERPLGNRWWRDADTAQMKALIDIRYLPFSTRNHDVAFTKVADDRHFHPIRDYLDKLPPWDGVERIPTLFVRCLQADDTEYIHTVSRKTFAAAVARVYQPGVKFDCILVLDGAQGIGKSTILKDLVGEEFYCETLALSDMEDKTGAEKLQGFWFAEIGELAGMKKADVEKVKDFLTVTDDKYRPSYGKVVESHPRQCVIIATVNGERGYLRDITGNRRFWIVKCHQEAQIKRFHFTPEERDQIWAEAKHIYESGEKLYLEGKMLSTAEELQRGAMEEDERQGLVEEYLDLLLPADWDSKDIYERRSYIASRGDPLTAIGTVRRETVSNAEIWCECFGKNLSELKPTDSYTIAALMTRVEGWERTKSSRRIPFYGKQRLYRRKFGF